MEEMVRKHFRVPVDVLQGLAVLAQGDGRSLNNYIVERVLRPHVESRPIVSLVGAGAGTGIVYNPKA